MSLKKLLDEISAIPGVTGSCVFDQDRNALCKSTDTKIDSEILKKVSSCLMRMLEMGKMISIGVSGSHYRFDNCTVVSTPLDFGSVLLTICDPKANCSLVATTAVMLADDLKAEIQKIVSEEPIVAQNAEEQNPETKSNQSIITPDLQEHLNQIEEALAEAIGPVAGMVIQDHLETWLQNGPAETTRLHELTEMLYEEINDDVLIKGFRDRIRKLF